MILLISILYVHNNDNNYEKNEAYLWFLNFMFMVKNTIAKTIPNIAKIDIITNNVLFILNGVTR